jgi:hypothetical protein
MLALSKVAIQAVGFISGFLRVPMLDGRYSAGCHEVPPKWTRRDAWNTRDHHHEIKRGDRRGLDSSHL